MKIFFIGSDRRKDENVKLYKKIVKNIEDSGHKVDKSWLDSTTEKDSIEFEKAHKRNLNSIKTCDIIIAEVSDMTSGVGFLISTALSEKKPVLALLREDAKIVKSITLRGSSRTTKLLQYKEYSQENLKKIVSAFLDEIKGMLDTKFILIISPEIEKYLEWVSLNRRMHKAQVVRRAVENMMEGDAEFKKYIKSTK